MILSNTFPGLLASVIPLSFEHFPLVTFPLYSFRIWPICQFSGISSFTWILLNASLKISLVFWFASMNVSLGMSSGPRLFFFLFSFFMAIPISLGVICSGSSVVCSADWSGFFLLLFRCILSSYHILGFLVLPGIGFQSILLCVLLFSQVLWWWFLLLLWLHSLAYCRFGFFLWCSIWCLGWLILAIFVICSIFFFCLFIFLFF